MGRITWQQVQDPLNEQILSEVEESFGIKFPSDYKECVIRFNGGRPHPSVFNFKDGGTGEFGYLLSFTEEPNIKMVYGLIADYLPKGVFPFATDFGGNKLCFDYRANKHSPSIVFYDHEQEEEDAIESICETFTELLDSLHYDED
ncbi:SMI1/KNR4 family protein [Bacillus sp. CLL-7-23]|uniref:SMI1/KNR4 family protein n=1 Tax=Bacillus changyiensis TaxID=3004103 RepID=A0ABT4X564_9BACI|nr:SMI1/KNR4 family protein [Bacillus changyiensis]MDA7027418.1 SMI1/KNR4 family protein [Bacillus changyiensis]